MTENAVGLYLEPDATIIHKYEQRGDGKWYLKEGEAADYEFHPGEYRTYDPVAQGDLNSAEKGSGARRNGGKERVDLIPVRFWFELYCREYNLPDRTLPVPADFMTSVQALAEFQEGRCSGEELLAAMPPWLFKASEPVWVYGADKYAAWNWLKGMPWSVPIGCAVRHANAIIFDQEEVDAESGFSHYGHYSCNIMMLSAYYRWYPEGNDMPAEAYFNATD